MGLLAQMRLKWNPIPLPPPGTYESVVALAAKVRKVGAGRGGIDYVILNAGTYGVDYTAAGEGW